MKYTLALLPSIVLALSSCSEKTKEVTDNNTKSEQSQVATLDSYLVDTAPDEAITINQLRAAAKAGAPVTFTGKILGAHTVLADNRAIMILGDPNQLTSCDLQEDDHCSMPWDVCCEDVDKVNANIVTVQVVDGTGRPLKNGFRNVGGISELAHITLSGTVAQGSNEKNMLVNADKIFVHPNPKQK